MTGAMYDVAVVGAGPNGLTAAAYLARAGARVIVFEQRFERGGTLASDDYSTPFLYNQAQFVLPFGKELPPYRDLDLAEHAVAFIEPPLAFAAAIDGDALVVERGGRGLGDELERMLQDASAMAGDLLLGTATQASARLDQGAPAGFDRLAAATPAQLSGLARDDRAALITRYACGLAGFTQADESLGAIGAVALARLFEPVLVAGGSKSLANGLFRVAARAGADCLVSARVVRVRPDDRAIEVGLADGRLFAARSLISTLDPITTFWHLLAEHADGDLRDAVAHWRLDATGAFTAHYGIKGAAPAPARRGDADDAVVRIAGFSSPADIDEHFRAVDAGELPARPAGHLTTTSRHDPLQASPGPYGPLHTLRYETLAPYAHPQRDWSRARVAYRRACWELICEEIDGASDATLLFEFADSPRDLERRFSTTRRGSLRQGALGRAQTLLERPHPSCADGRTPIPGVYLGGGGAHPGVPGTLTAGRQAAAAVCADLGFERWWH